MLSSVGIDLISIVCAGLMWRPGRQLECYLINLIEKDSSPGLAPNFVITARSQIWLFH